MSRPPSAFCRGSAVAVGAGWSLAVAALLANVTAMSRRSRRRRRASGGGAGWFGKALIVSIVCGLVGTGLLYLAIRSYLHSESFREFLAKKAGDAAGVEGSFTPFRWEGLAVNTGKFEGSGEGLVRKLRIEGVQTEIGIGGLHRGVWELRGSQVQRLDITVDASGASGATDVASFGFQPGALAPSDSASGWLPRKIDLRGLDVSDLIVRANLKAGPGRVSGVRMTVEPDARGAAYRVELSDGEIELPSGLIPQIRLQRAGLRYLEGVVFLNSAQAAVWKDGRIDASGEWDARTGSFIVQGDVTGATCEDLFNETWAKRFTGELGSDFTLQNRSGERTATGMLVLRDGTLTALPVLDALAAYADTRRFRVLKLNEARTVWYWKQDELRLTDLVIASDGLVRVEGAITIRGKDLDGSFRLGLAPGTLANIPGAETHVFFPGERGLLWAPVRITGTLDDPREDLTERLIEAAGLRMFDVIPETGEKVIKFTRSVIGDAPSKAVDAAVGGGARIIETGAGVVGEVGNVLGGILGGTRPTTPEPIEPKETPPEPEEP